MLKTLNAWNTSKVKSAFTLGSQVTFWSISSLAPPQKTQQPRGPLQDGTKNTGSGWNDIFFGITCYTWVNLNKEYMTIGTISHGIIRACGSTWSRTTWNFRNYRCWTTWKLTYKHSTLKNTFTQSLQGMSINVLPRSVASWADGSSNTKPILGETSRQPL